MNDRKLLKIGIVGSAIVAICCFTPVLVIGFGVIGLAAWVGWLDTVLFPALALFLALTGYAIYRVRRGDLARTAGEGKATGPS